jgi:hypothetical protein
MDNPPCSKALACAVALAALAVTAPLASAPAQATASDVANRATRTISAANAAHLHLVSSSGSALVEEGNIRGSLDGKVTARFNVGATVYGSFTIDLTQGGWITGRGSGTLHNGGLYQSFGGTLLITGGGGPYAHAHGHGGFYGTINRRTYAMTVQTTGTLDY